MKTIRQICEQVRANKKIIERFLGYTNRPTPSIILRKIEQELEHFEEYLEIDYGYHLSPFRDFIYGDIVYTVGAKIEEPIGQYISSSEAIRGMILDKIAILTLDYLKEAIYEEIYTVHGLLRETEWYPGSKDLPLSAQRDILQKVRIHTVTINETFQLYPIKTVALKARFGNKLKLQNPCDSCLQPCERKRSEEENLLSFLQEKAATTTKHFYQQHGLSDKLYQDNIQDIQIWSGHYEQSTGRLGIEKRHFPWLDAIAEGKIIKFGRLQFEPLSCTDVPPILSSTFAQPPLYLRVHIREGEPFTANLCDASYKMAKEFYLSPDHSQILPDKILPTRICFLCDSWLLHPLLGDLLPSDSNILSFQKKYTLLSQDPQNRQMEERVFGFLSDRPEDYPANTSLQRALKKALLEGSAYGTALGYFM